MLSVLDIFRVGIGPSSSHTVGPMRIAARFIRAVGKSPEAARIAKLKFSLRGSLAFTGHGHGTPRAVVLGALGYAPETIDVEKAEADLTNLNTRKQLTLPSGKKINFDPEFDVWLDFETLADLHPNEMHCAAIGEDDDMVVERVYYSTGGGFIASREQLMKPAEDDQISSGRDVPHPFGSAEELLKLCADHQKSIDEIILENEHAMRSAEQTRASILSIYQTMMMCIDRGLSNTGVLPGELKVERRAALLWEKLKTQFRTNETEKIFDWLNVYAMAVNEENAAGGQVVTAPTNGAAGIIPAVLRQYCYDEASEDAIVKFLATAGGIGLLYKQRASISGAEMGCQGEVGVACSMAAAGLAAIWDCTPHQVAQAAEIGMEHNLGLTCDPVGGLVQIPCIERNAIGAVKAVNAARMALNAVVEPRVTLDQVIETMRQTGLDMSSKYKETSQGGLAVNVVEC